MRDIPKHIAIIMDGNGRWANERSLPRTKGHEQGIKSVHAAIEGCLETNVSYLTLFAFSIENWKRPKSEVATLMTYLSKYLDDEREMLHEKKIRFNVVGRWKDLQDDIRQKIVRNAKESKGYDKLTLTLALNYGARTEIIDVIRNIVKKCKENILDEEALTEEVVENELYTAGLPDPDLLIRTSGEMRISNFLLWQISYTELLFLEKYWPDFDKNDLIEAVKEYKNRNRRFGDIK